ncbi:MAG: DUF1902 domain-containing protein [Selenomonadaceae bacterium]|nr:DUF1902 domain-containing protein [Selenomonadaceae bacterium]
MIEAQTLEQMNLDGSKLINFAPAELKIFKEELDKQFAEGNGVDIFKALRNARYLAMLDRSFKEIEEGHYIEFADEEWEKFINDKDFEVIIMGNYRIQLVWDNESKVWTATSEDIPGLILEDESAAKLIKRVMLVAPEI